MSSGNCSLLLDTANGTTSNVTVYNCTLTGQMTASGNNDNLASALVIGKFSGTLLNITNVTIKPSVIATTTRAGYLISRSFNDQAQIFVNNLTATSIKMNQTANIYAVGLLVGETNAKLI